MISNWLMEAKWMVLLFLIVGKKGYLNVFTNTESSTPGSSCPTTTSPRVWTGHTGKCIFSNISFLNFLSAPPPNIWSRRFSLFSVCCVNADLVPVRDWAHEKGLPGRVLSTAPPSALPEEQAGKEEHCSMRRLFNWPHWPDTNVFLYIPPPFVCHSCQLVSLVSHKTH